MKTYKLDRKYFANNENDIATLGKDTFEVNFNSEFSQKVLSKLHIQGKPYVICEDDEEEVVVVKPQPKAKNKKVKIDEPKKAKAKPKSDKQESES